MMEHVRQVRALDPLAILGCPRCLEGDRESVPGARISWHGWCQEQSSFKQPHIPAARKYVRHLEEVHNLDSSELRRKDLPIILWAPGSYMSMDLLLYRVAGAILVSPVYA